ncbi:tyrosine-protein kinase domain-containing protein [Arthrobacter sp. MDT3-44]
MELRNYLRVLKRNWLIIAGATLAGVIVAGIASMLMKPIYTAQTELFVAVEETGSVAELQQGNTFMQDRVQTYTEMVDSPRVLQPIITSLGLDADTAADLPANVTAYSTPNTVLVGLWVTDESPEQAAAIANALADSLISVIDELETTGASSVSPVQLSVLTEAGVPTEPSSPKVDLNLIIGLLVGLALGLTVALLRAKFDNRVRGEADLYGVTKAPVLGMVRYDPAAAGNPLIASSKPNGSRAEAFRQLRTNLKYTQLTRGSRVVQVTSSLPGEGKTTTAINLAFAMAKGGKRVLLVDADLRRPAVAGYLGIEGSAGLTTVLIGQAQLGDMLQPWGEDNLHVLASGPIPPNPSELLGSDQMVALLRELEETFDAVIIDAPPVLPVTDAAVLSSAGVNTVLVVGAQEVNTTDVYESLKALELAGGRVLGLILNKLRLPEPDAKARSYYTAPAASDVVLPDAPMAKPKSGLPEDQPTAAPVRPSHDLGPVSLNKKRPASGSRPAAPSVKIPAGS